MTTIREYVSKFSYENDEQALRGIQAGAVAAFAAVAAAAAAIGVGVQQARRIAQEVAAVGDASRKMGQQIGFTTEQIQQLNFALGIASDISVEEARGSFVRMTRSAYDASQGMASAADSFAALGVSVTDANGDLKAAPDLLLDLAEGFSRMPDGIEKTALAAEIFGRSGTQMLQFLNLGSAGARELMEEASALGGVMSDEAAQQAEVYNDTMTRLKTAIQGVKNEVASVLIPLFSEGAQRRLDLLMRNRERVSEALQISFRFLLGAADFLLTAFERMTTAASSAIEKFGGFAQVASVLGFILTSIAVTVIGTMLRGAILSLIGWLSTVTAGFTAAGIAAAAWNVAMMLIPLAIGAMIVLLAVFADDLRRFLEGEDSAIGRLAEQWIADGDGLFSRLGRFLFDVRDNWEMAFTLMRADWQFTVDQMQSGIDRLKLRFNLFVADVMAKVNLIAPLLSVVPGMGGVSSALSLFSDATGGTEAASEVRDRLRTQLDAEIAANAAAVANHTQARVELATQLRMDAEARRVQVDASGDTTIQVQVQSGDADVIATAIEDRMRARDNARTAELARALGQGG